MKIRDRKIDLSFLNDAPLEEVPCSLCGSREATTLSRRDALGLPVSTVMCQSCGLIYINPRPAMEWYKTFYSSVGGKQHVYKASAHTDESKPIGSGFEAACRHGRGLAERLGKYMRSGLTIDVGSSEGGVLAGLRDCLNIIPIGIEPVPAEAQFAAKKGIPTRAVLIENIESSGVKIPPADNIICLKSLNHFLNPAFFFAWAWKTLKPDGRLILEVKNFRHQARRSGRVYAGIQLDHPYMFVPETVSAFVTAAGFNVLFFDVDEGKSAEKLRAQKKIGLPSGHIRIAAAKTQQPPFKLPFVPEPAIVAALERALNPFSLYWHYFFHYATVRRNLLRRLSINTQGPGVS
ncbi:MAG: methyltransferase domain-containing protein [Candidatus Sungbacteria bacterium]|nr:methyltransferase domain-containing protein [Candidatus Sungbacteria bacterium]